MTLHAVASWRREHENFAFLLDFIEHHLKSGVAWTRADFDLVVDVVAHLNAFRDRYHCSREEAAFSLIAQKDPATARTVNRLLLEHRVISSKGQKVYGLLAESTGVASLRALAELRKYVRYARHHEEREEQSVLTRAMESLTEPEWQLIEHAAPPGPEPFREFSKRRYDPTFGDEASQSHRMLCERISHSSQRSGRGVLARRSSSRPTSAVQGAAAIAGPTPSRTVARSAPERRGAPAKFKPAWMLVYLSRYRQAALLLALVLAYLQYYFLDVNLEIMRLPAIVVYLFKWLADAPVAS